MKYEYKPKGICAHLIELDVDGDTINSVYLYGGCDGNHKGLTALLRGMKVDEAISRLEGITCKVRPTSCPDQVAQALKLIRDGAL